jgi:DNA-binding winged helix-turn-helix (wHTH) protein/tetratricopeptide (TPR) repeat protein
MAAPAGEIFEFGEFTLDPTDRLLLLRGQPLRLTPKTFDLLVALVRHRGSLMTKDRLLDMIWPKVFVAEINLSVNISTLRKLLMRSRGRPTFIETVPTHGYRFVAPVKIRSGTATLFLRTGSPRSGKRLPPDEDARRACLQGRYHWNRRTAEGLDRAIQHYWRSLAFDANFAPAHAGLADAHAAKGYLSYVAPADAFPAAARHAAMALELDDKLAEPHASLGYVKLYHGWDWDGAEREFRRAIDLDRSNAAAHQWLATFLLAAGRADEALDEIRWAHAGDPLSRAINTDVGFIHYYSGRYDEAIKQLDAVLEMDPEFPPAHLWKGRSLQELGQHDAAIAAFQRVDEQLQGWPVSVAARGHVQALCGRTAAAHETIAELRQLATRTFVTAYGIALVYAGLGETDAAFAWLDRAFEERSHWLVWLRLDPRWGTIRTHARFLELVSRLNYPSRGVSAIQ